MRSTERGSESGSEGMSEGGSRTNIWQGSTANGSRAVVAAEIICNIEEPSALENGGWGGAVEGLLKVAWELEQTLTYAHTLITHTHTNTNTCVKLMSLWWTWSQIIYKVTAPARTAKHSVCVCVRECVSGCVCEGVCARESVSVCEGVCLLMCPAIINERLKLSHVAGSLNFKATVICSAMWTDRERERQSKRRREYGGEVEECSTLAMVPAAIA